MTLIRSAKDIGREIRSRRKTLGYTQQFLASYAGVSTSFLSELENGKPTIQFDKMLYISNLLGIDLFAERRDAHA